MHNTAFRRESVNAVMLPLKVRALDDLLTVVRDLPLGGVAVTMPLKQEVLPHLANMDPLTAQIGACNTLRTAADGKLYGFNTDVAGVVRPLEKRIASRRAHRRAGRGRRGPCRRLRPRRAGRGGLRRQPHPRESRLARQGRQGQRLKHEQLAKQHFDALINTTPCGMTGIKQPLPIKENELNAALVFDMVYNPLETPLLKLANSRGIPVISGLEMFVQQGARQFEIWTGKPAPEAEMLRVVERELRRR